MKLSLKMLFTVALCVSFVPVQAIAGGGFTSESNTGIRITSLNQRQCTSSERGFEVLLDTKHANPDVCTNSRRLVLRCDGLKIGGFKEPFESAAALFRMAFDSDYVVRVYVNGCDDDGRAKVKAVEVLRESAEVQPN